MKEQLVCEVISKARAIVQYDMVFQMKRRMNHHHSEVDKKYEQDLHDTQQKTAWDEVKEYAVKHRDDILEYRKEVHKSDQQIIDSILAVIDDEINEILLED